MFVSQSVVRTQMAAIDALERQLRVASSNNTALQRQQAQLMESVHTLINMVATTTGTYSLMFLLAFSNFVLEYLQLSLQNIMSANHKYVQGLTTFLPIVTHHVHII